MNDRELLSLKNAYFSYRTSYRGSNERYSTQWSSMDWGSYRAAIKEIESFLIDRTSYRECDNKKLKGLDRWPICQELSRSYRDCLKIVFQRREEHRYECNQTCYSTNDPINIWSSQKHLLTKKKKKCKAFKIQNTHTLNKFYQFYILKTS